MKLEINIPNILYQAELYVNEENHEMICDEAFLIGEVILKENDFTMNLVSEEDRKELVTRIHLAIRDFIVEHIAREDCE